MEGYRYKWWKGMAFGLVGILFLAGVVFVVMELWNWLMPDIFGLDAISYWQALGLLVLSKILLSPAWFRKRSHGHSSWQWRRRFMHKWENMSEEDRERIRNRCRPPTKEN